MYLYRIEVTYADHSRSEVVVLHESEEKAFRSAGNQLEHHNLPPKKIQELVLVEKKPASAGRGFVVDV